jgi:hypothetical protein
LLHGTSQVLPKPSADAYDQRLCDLTASLARRPESTMMVVAHWGVLRHLGSSSSGECGSGDGDLVRAPPSAAHPCGVSVAHKVMGEGMPSLPQLLLDQGQDGVLELELAQAATVAWEVGLRVDGGGGKRGGGGPYHGRRDLPVWRSCRLVERLG